MHPIENGKRHRKVHNNYPGFKAKNYFFQSIVIFRAAPKCRWYPQLQGKNARPVLITSDTSQQPLMTVTPACCKLVSETPEKSLPVATGALWWERVSASGAATVFGPLLKRAFHNPHLNKLCSPKAYSLLPEIKSTAQKLWNHAILIYLSDLKEWEAFGY